MVPHLKLLGPAFPKEKDIVSCETEVIWEAHEKNKAKKISNTKAKYNFNRKTRNGNNDWNTLHKEIVGSFGQPANPYVRQKKQCQG